MSGVDPRTVGGEDEREWDDPPGVGEDPDPIEPGQPSAENVAFVLLGVLLGLYVIARLAGLV